MQTSVGTFVISRDGSIQRALACQDNVGAVAGDCSGRLVRMRRTEPDHHLHPVCSRARHYVVCATSALVHVNEGASACHVPQRAGSCVPTD